MLFSSISFLYIFLPLVILLYFSVKKEFRNFILLFASIIFYGMSNVKYLVLLFLVILINYFGSLLVNKAKKNFAQKLILFTTVLLNLSVLIYFKYFNFIIENICFIKGIDFTPINIILPIGISFYIFQSLSYVFDVYAGICRVQRNILKLSLYISSFPQLVAGPIIKYRDIEKQLEHRETNFDNVVIGVKRFIIGLAKKVVIADTIGIIVDKIYMQDPENFSHGIAWLGSFLYSFQIYFDFSGYSDMAIGLGLIFGFKFMENFNYPYISKSITEFWHRWHISLSTWFKNYVYIPMGGNKHGKLRTSLNLFIVFLLTGIWHGANWTFVVWGMWNVFFIILEKFFNIKEFDNKPHLFIINFIRQVVCFVIVSIGFVFFRSDNISYAIKYLGNTFGILKPCADNYVCMWNSYVQNYEYIILAMSILLSIPILRNIWNNKNFFIRIIVNICLLCIFFLSIITLAANTYKPFIYFQF